MKYSSLQLSVVIVTKNRSSDLKKCLTSLKLQTKHPNELLVINNNSTDTTVETVKSFARNMSYPVRIILEKGQGYPIIYNRGLKEAKHHWIAFIDDDCIANPTWIETILSSVKKYSNAAAILGLSETLYPHNPYAFSTFILNYIWKENGTYKTRIFDGEILDNKNIVYNKTFLKKHSLSFNEKRAKLFFGSSEDCELGHRITQTGGDCIYDKSIRVKHKDPTTFVTCMQKFIRSYRGYLAYQSSLPGTIKSSRSPTTRLRVLLPSFMKTYSLSWKQQWCVIFVLSCMVIVRHFLTVQAFINKRGIK